MVTLAVSSVKAQKYPRPITETTTIITNDTLWILTHGQYKSALRQITEGKEIIAYQDSIVQSQKSIMFEYNNIIGIKDNQIIDLKGQLKGYKIATGVSVGILVLYTAAKLFAK
jgi:hypothetical protein